MKSQRAICLQIDKLTTTKLLTLRKFQGKALALANSLLKQRKSKRLMELHNASYLASKQTTNFNSQVICDIERNVVKTNTESIKKLTVKFNIPRNCKTFKTRSRSFVKLGLQPRQRIAIPIRENRSYQRYSTLLAAGWTCKTYGLTSDLQIVAYLNKEDSPEPTDNVAGVDVNSKCFAVTILSGYGKVLKQLYFGKDIWTRRKRIMERRARLQSINNKGSSRARRSLLLLKTKEANFVRNRIGEVVKQIVTVARRYNARIAIEGLVRFNRKGRNFNREVFRLPFYKFRETLAGRCFDNQVELDILDSYHTSKWCSDCGAVGDGHSKSNYALFRCRCGLEVNSDRKASLAIAIKSQLKRDHAPNRHTQFFNWQAPVNGLLRRNEVDLYNGVVQSNQPTESLCP